MSTETARGNGVCILWSLWECVPLAVSLDVYARSGDVSTVGLSTVVLLVHLPVTRMDVPMDMV